MIWAYLFYYLRTITGDLSPRLWWELSAERRVSQQHHFFFGVTTKTRTCTHADKTFRHTTTIHESYSTITTENRVES